MAQKKKENYKLGELELRCAHCNAKMEAEVVKTLKKNELHVKECSCIKTRIERALKNA